MSRVRLACAGMALALLMLAGACAGEAGPVTRNPSGSGGSGPVVPAPATIADPELAQRKAAANIADCPPSDPTVAAREDGLPDITLACLGGGKSVRLAGLRGKPLVINVWAQWCGPCRTEAPHLTEVFPQFEGRVQFLGIDYQDPRPELAIAFADEAGWTYPQLVDEDRQIQPALGLIGPPMTVFVDAEGVIVYKHPGVISSTSQLKDMIAEHLGVR